MSACDLCANCSCNKYIQLAKPLDVAHKPIMVIGDSVTPSEARKGICMTGPAVNILQKAMQRVGLPYDRDSVHYTTAVLCAVPKKKGAQFPREPISSCRPRLLEEISRVNPKIILVLGKVAAQAITGNFNIKVTEMQGRLSTIEDTINNPNTIMQYSLNPDTVVLPIIHPAMLIRAPKDYKPFFASLQLAASIYKGGAVHDTGETSWQVLDSEEKCDKAIEFLKKYPRVAADIETTSLDYRVAEFCVMGMCFEKNKVFIIPREMRHRCKDFFAIPNLKWTWHHGKYDRKVMWRRLLTEFDDNGWHIFPHDNDTLYMHYVLDETSAHDLGSLTKTFLQAAEYKYKMNQEFKSVTLETYDSYFEALCERVAVDCDYSYQLEEVLQAELDKEENASVKHAYENLIMPAASFLARVEQNGMLVDEDFLLDMNAKYDKLLADLLAEIEELAAPYWDPEEYMQKMGAKTAPAKFNPASPKQMSWMVFHKLRLKPRRRQGTSTNANVLESIEEDVPLIKKVLEYRGVAKEKSTYVVGILNRRDIDGRVRSNFSLHITATGRLSSKEPNVQNIPSANGVGNVRRAFIPKKGKILMEVDYSGAELRWLAFLSNCPVLKSVFIEGRNLHKETAVALYGKGFTPTQKMRAKAVNFGIPYGREAQSFKEEFNISIEEAQGMIDNWLNNYYGARDYLNWCAAQVLEGKYLQTPWGNRRRAGLVTSESLHSLQNEYKNFPIQSSSSHTLLYSAMKLEKELKEKYDVDILDLIHDSMLLEVPMDLETVKAVSKLTSEFMASVPATLFNCDVPFATDTDLGPDWGNLKAFNNEKGVIEIENELHEVQEVPYEEWIQSVYHWDIYESESYKNLQRV